MKNVVARCLQVVVVLFGLGVMALMLWEPHVEGRNAHATIFEVYFKDPFLAYVYVGSIPFFVGLHRAFRLFGHWRENPVISPATVESLRGIKRCAIGLLEFIAGGMVIILVFGDREDRPVGVFMSVLFMLAAGAVAVATAFVARIMEARGRPSEAAAG